MNVWREVASVASFLRAARCDDAEGMRSTAVVSRSGCSMVREKSPLPPFGRGGVKRQCAIPLPSLRRKLGSSPANAGHPEMLDSRLHALARE